MKLFSIVLACLALSTLQQTTNRTIFSGGYVATGFLTTYSSISFSVDVFKGSNVNVYLLDATDYANYPRTTGSPWYQRLGLFSGQRISSTFSVTSLIQKRMYLVVENKGNSDAEVRTTQTGTSSTDNVLDATIIIYIVVFVILGCICLPCILVGAILSAISPFLPFIIIAVIIVLVLRRNNDQQGAQGV